MLEDLKKITNFITRFEGFKYLVIRFSPCNKRVSCQNFINNTLFDFLYRFVQAYLDDVFIYGKMLKNQYLHVEQVVEYLQKGRIHADINKCKFYVPEISFFSCIISTKSISIDSGKIGTIFN